jgi:hypothetical protein
VNDFGVIEWWLKKYQGCGNIIEDHRGVGIGMHASLGADLSTLENVMARDA